MEVRRLGDTHLLRQDQKAASLQQAEDLAFACCDFLVREMFLVANGRGVDQHHQALRACALGAVETILGTDVHRRRAWQLSLPEDFVELGGIVV